MFGKKGQELIHLRKLGTIEDEFAFLPSADQAGMRKFFHVKGQSRRCKLQLLTDLSDRHPSLASYDQQAINAEARWLGQSGKGNNSLISIHRRSK